MITHHSNNRCSSLVVSLAECPWLRGTNVQLPGYIFYKYISGQYGRDGQLHGGVKIRCYEAVGNNYVVDLFYNESSDPVEVQRAKGALENFFSDLYTPRNCEVDPITGKPPVDEYTDFF